MWNILNVKSPVSGIRLNDPDRNTISDENDPRFLLDMAASFSEMDPRILPKNMRVNMLTTDTSEALVLTLRGIVSLVKICCNTVFPMLCWGRSKVTESKENLVYIVKKQAATIIDQSTKC